MIELTVKTLDSQNHAFAVEDDITVSQFKETIAGTVNIPADTQRIIYCGRVLQDNSKLSDYDVNGKVVHLVQRPPPSLNPNPNRPASPQQPQRRPFRGFDSGNTMYLGSMAIPSSLLESQNIAPPLPTHSLAVSRLNVAKRMLRRADTVLNLLENPTARTEQNPPEETVEEVTPVFEARVIVPANAASDVIEEALVLSAVENNLLNAGATSVNAAQPESVQNSSNDTNIADANVEDPPAHSASSTPEGVTPVETLPGETEQGAAASATPGEGASSSTNQDNISRTSEMEELLDSLNRIQIRFAPFLARYHTFMREDPVVAPENARQVQAMINRVSEVLHILGHAYHSLSDIILRVRTAPPRPLLCRPILIQHSAVVQAGIPIQLEAQINFSADRNDAPVNSGGTPQTANATTATNTPPTTTSSNATATVNMPTAHMMVGYPLYGETGTGTNFGRGRGRIVTSLRGLRPNNNSIAFNVGRGSSGSITSNRLNDVLNSAGFSDAATPGSLLASVVEAVSQSVANSTPVSAPPTTTTTTGTASESFNPFDISDFDNPNVEFFMEVTPESITIDSLETALVGSNQASDILRGALNGPPPELFQSLMQMAGQIAQAAPPMAATTNANEASAQPSAPPAESSASASQPAASSSGQNSQARGNTQTNPTTSTHTRSTSRPHVHLAQHAMQGFDPFLPCNSHHVTPRRRQQIHSVRPVIHHGNAPQARQTQSTASGATGPPTNGTDQRQNPVYDIMQGILNSIRAAYQTSRPAAPPTTTPPATTVSSSTNTTNAAPPPPAPPAAPPVVSPAAPPAAPPRPANIASMSQFLEFLPHLHNMNLSDMSSQGPSIADLLHQLPDENYVEGESIFSDLIMLLSRNMNIGDIVQLNHGRLEPLMRIRTQLRTFVLCKVLNGSQSNVAIDRGVNRLIADMQYFLDNVGLLDTRDGIDIVRSTQTFFRARLPNIISLAASRSPNSLRMLVDQCRTTGRQLVALILAASGNGQQGVEDLFDHILSRFMQGIPRDIQQWTLITSRVHLRSFIEGLSVPASILQPYIVRTVDAITPTYEEAQNASNPAVDVELMDCEDQVAGGSTADLSSAISLAQDPEPVPTVVLGSESWHNEVPNDWVPIIARDTHKQRRQNSQAPFSDAYLSGMPSKRRKIVTSTKPQGSLPQVITDSVRRAVTATGLAQVAPVEVVSQGASAELNIQSAYRDLLRTSVQSSLRDNEDFTPDRFPNASNYFNNSQ